MPSIFSALKFYSALKGLGPILASDYTAIGVDFSKDSIALGNFIAGKEPKGTDLASNLISTTIDVAHKTDDILQIVRSSPVLHFIGLANGLVATVDGIGALASDAHGLGIAI